LLIFEPEFSSIRWALVESYHYEEGVFNGAAARIDEIQEQIEAAGEFAYVLPHGGSLFRQPAVRLVPQLLREIERTIPYYPEANQAIYKLAAAVMEERPDAGHALLCETAPFTAMPDPACRYALSGNLSGREIRRYGGDGLCHLWLTARVARHLQQSQARTVSIHLGNQSSMAAFTGASARETSMGFTPVDGIPSTSTCGSIDPSIPLLLSADGQSTAEIRRLLTHDSGLSAVVGQPVTYEELLQDSRPAAVTARKMLSNALLKAIGEAMAALAGLDVLAFACQDVSRSLAFIQEITRPLEFLSIAWLESPEESDGVWQLSQPKSSVTVLAFQYDRYQTLAALAASVF
jgi:acetate kinase